MIDQLDDALRDFLIRELPIRDNEVDISFEQPKREWSARLSRPTINLFLRDIRENTKLRSPGPTFQERRNGDAVALLHHGVRFDLFYLVTAWAQDPLDEHRILSRMLSALFRLRAVPDDILAEHLPGQESGVPLKLAQYDTQGGISDLWSVLDNELRPAIDIVATATIQPFVEADVPIVRGLDVRLRQIGAAPGSAGSVGRILQVGGDRPHAAPAGAAWPPDSASPAALDAPASSTTPAAPAASAKGEKGAKGKAKPKGP